MLLDAKVRDYIRDNQDGVVSDIGRLVAQPSVSTRGEGIRECAQLVKRMVEEVGGKSALLELEGAAPLVYGEFASSRSPRTILFYNHYDVQPETPLELWRSPPFKPEVRDGRLYGRGASDDKGEIVARLKLLEAYVKVHGEPPCNIKLCIEGEEEVGSGHLDAYVASNPELFRSDAVVWEDGIIDEQGRPTVSLGMKGMMYLELTLKELSRDAHSKYAAALPSAPWRMFQLLRTMKDESEKITIPGWYDDVRALSAEEERIVAEQPSEAERLVSAYGADGFAGKMTLSEARMSLVAAPTANIAGIWAGYAGQGSKTVLPSEAHCRIDFRLVPDQDPEKLYELFIEHLQVNGFSDVGVQKKWMEPASRTDYNGQWARAAIAGARDVFMKEPTIELSSAGTGPAYVFARRYGVPVACMGVSPSDAGAHAPNESLRLDYLERGMLWIGEAMENYLSSS